MFSKLLAIFLCTYSIATQSQSFEITKNDLLLIIGMQKCIRNKSSDIKKSKLLLPVITKIKKIFEEKGNVGQVVVFHPENHAMFFNNRVKKANMHDEVYEFINTPSGRKILSYHLKEPYCIAFTDDVKPDFEIETKLWQDSNHALIGDFNIKIGTNPMIPERSAFMDIISNSTRFDEILNSKKINRIFLVGHPLETLVYNTAIDGKKNGFEVIIIRDASLGFRKANLDFNGIKMTTAGMIN